MRVSPAFVLVTIVVSALLSGFFEQAAASQAAKCAEKAKVKCKRTKDNNVKICAWKSKQNACATKDCISFGKKACEKVSHCDYDATAKTCVEKGTEAPTSTPTSEEPTVAPTKGCISLGKKACKKDDLCEYDAAAETCVEKGTEVPTSTPTSEEPTAAPTTCEAALQEAIDRAEAAEKKKTC